MPATLTTPVLPKALNQQQQGSASLDGGMQLGHLCACALEAHPESVSLTAEPQYSEVLANRNIVFSTRAKFREQQS